MPVPARGTGTCRILGACPSRGDRHLPNPDSPAWSADFSGACPRRGTGTCRVLGPPGGSSAGGQAPAESWGCPEEVP
ncbi:hypothetical protein CAL23_22375 [Bordetella genomosp. 6]|uniref:Uncharacterized protein n=1 Tax=Bordetella genomosp. 6 TaxID=463024 RepID=A0ABX4F7R6_9BORD|nr:hypothetical protein CAL23_22375 [Bordetella genomosp. 6]